MNKGYQPNKGKLNPDNPPRGGCGLPHHSIKGERKMAAMGNITMEVGHFYVKTFEIQALIEAEKAKVTGMRAENDYRLCERQTPRFTMLHFQESNNKLIALADELRIIWKELTGKEGLE